MVDASWRRFAEHNLRSILPGWILHLYPDTKCLTLENRLSYTLFDGHRRIAAGTLAETTRALHEASTGGSQWLLLFEDATGRQIDVDARAEPASPADAALPPEPVSAGEASTAPRGPGRPRLGVVAREVTLLPHHWEWLAAQPGGASVTLRKLVEHARKAGASDERARNAREASYRFLHAIAGNLPDYEEVTRALFAADVSRMEQLMLTWPTDVREHAVRLATPND